MAGCPGWCEATGARRFVSGAMVQSPHLFPQQSMNLFVAVGHNGQRIVSGNGAEWKNSQTGKEGETYRVVAFGNGRFVAAGSFGGNIIFAVTTQGEKWEY